MRGGCLQHKTLIHSLIVGAHAVRARTWPNVHSISLLLYPSVTSETIHLHLPMNPTRIHMRRRLSTMLRYLMIAPGSGSQLSGMRLRAMRSGTACGQRTAFHLSGTNVQKAIIINVM